MHEVLRDTHNADPKIRAAALLQLCPCQLRINVKEAWIRHFEIIYDSDAKVRSIALHNMCDGSPAELETNVVSAVEYLTKDTDKKIRRRARRVMAVYRRTGKINQDKA
ncbi:MAG: hypothetical protein VX292_03800 [Pseudomonadota bacterium]|nr:hypothetical protein [Pseudomonadota bacterium]